MAAAARGCLGHRQPTPPLPGLYLGHPPCPGSLFHFRHAVSEAALNQPTVSVPRCRLPPPWLLPLALGSHRSRRGLPLPATHMSMSVGICHILSRAETVSCSQVQAGCPQVARCKLAVPRHLQAPSTERWSEGWGSFLRRGLFSPKGSAWPYVHRTKATRTQGSIYVCACMYIYMLTRHVIKKGSWMWEGRVQEAACIRSRVNAVFTYEVLNGI